MGNDSSVSGKLNTNNKTNTNNNQDNNFDTKLLSDTFMKILKNVSTINLLVMNFMKLNQKSQTCLTIFGIYYYC